MLIRYELYLDGQYQCVGMFQGLDVLGLSHEEETLLLEPFNQKMPIPQVDYMETPCYFFKESAARLFHDDIARIRNLFEETGIFEIREIHLDENNILPDDILYEDAYQVVIHEGTFSRDS